MLLQLAEVQAIEKPVSLMGEWWLEGFAPPPPPPRMHATSHIGRWACERVVVSTCSLQRDKRRPCEPVQLVMATRRRAAVFAALLSKIKALSAFVGKRGV